MRRVTQLDKLLVDFTLLSMTSGLRLKGSNIFRGMVYTMTSVYHPGHMSALEGVETLHLRQHLQLTS